MAAPRQRTTSPPPPVRPSIAAAAVRELQRLLDRVVAVAVDPDRSLDDQVVVTTILCRLLTSTSKAAAVYDDRGDLVVPDTHPPVVSQVSHIRNSSPPRAHRRPPRRPRPPVPHRRAQHPQNSFRRRAHPRQPASHQHQHHRHRASRGLVVSKKEREPGSSST